jgi:hypothetical protein
MATYAVPVSNQITTGASSDSAVSWAAVMGGAVVAAALSLILIALGAGFGLSAVSPWEGAGASASTVGGVGIAWLIVSQAIAAAMGGYLAGRLRTKWVSVHTDEVYFRDTAHGFLVWAVGVVLTASLLTSAGMSMAGTSKPSAEGRSGNSYFADSLLRTDRATSDKDVAEVEGILAYGLLKKEIPGSDRTYLTTLVMARTGLAEGDARNRVDSVLTEAKQAANETRKAVAHLLLWTFLALLIGAFCASFAATVGGKQRDQAKTAGL